MKILSFTLGPHAYGLPIEPVREIIGVGDVTPVPLTPGFLCGVINLRGAVVPVIDLGVRLGLPAATRTERSCILVVDSSDETDGSRQPMGLLVDAVQEVLRLGEGARAEPPRFGTRVDPVFVRAVCPLPAGPLLLLELDQVLALDALTREIEEGLSETAEAGA